MLALCGAAGLGCYAPLIETGTTAVTAIPVRREKAAGGIRSALAVGVTPREGAGVHGKLELTGTYDRVRGTIWAGRVHAGWAFVPRVESAKPYPEIGADIGSRFDGGIFQNGLEWGVRGAAVFRLSSARRMPDNNDAFVLVGRGVDFLVTLRAGESYYHGAHVVDVSTGITLRVRAWSDMLWP